MKQTNDDLLRKRDAFSTHLREQGVGGVVSVGLGQRDGEPVFVVLTRSASGKGIPNSFAGMAVVANTMPGLPVGQGH